MAGVALAAGTMMVGGWTSVIPTATGTRPVAVALATPSAVTPPRHDTRHALKAAHHRVARGDVTVTKETTETETTTIVPAAPAVVVPPPTTTTRSVTETTTTR
jgi:hypothetical protein